MTGTFGDHPRKRVVREQWDTPLLRWVWERWGKRMFFYLGLPGPEALDIKLWRSMVSRVIAFELETESGNPRGNIVRLNRNLALMGVRHDVYCGAMEEVILRKKDCDGKEFRINEAVTLYNLDFCNAITGSVKTAKGMRRLRFECLREIAVLQRALFRETGIRRFVLLMTCREDFHIEVVRSALAEAHIPRITRDLVAMAGEPVASPKLPQLGTNTKLLWAFVFTCLRECFRGQGISPIFMPPVIYKGCTAASPMIHFVVVCTMAEENAAMPSDTQPLEAVHRLPILRADDGRILVVGSEREVEAVTDPTVFLAGFPCVVQQESQG